MKRTICRLLMALMLWAPYHFATAGMIGTPAAPAGVQADRDTLVNQLAALGVDAASAQERVAAMTDEEARALAGEIANLPAGGVYSAGIVAIIILAVVGYALYKHFNPY